MDHGSSSTELEARPRPVTSTRLQGFWLILARVLWLAVAALAFVYVAAGIRLVYYDRRVGFETMGPYELRQFGLSPEWVAVYFAGLPIAVTLSFFVVAVVVFWRRSDHWMSIFVSIVLLAVGSRFALFSDVLERWHPEWRVPAACLMFLTWSSSLLLFYIFPNGRFVPRWTRFLGGVWIVWLLAAYIYPGLGWTEPYWPLVIVLWIGWYSSGVFAQIYRYVRVSSPIERQQTKWVLFGLAAPVVAFIMLIIVLFLDHDHSLIKFGFGLWMEELVVLTVISSSLLCVPLTIGIAVLRRGLWDIDPLINRTLVYGTLIVLLLLTYGASVIVLQRGVRLLTQHESELATVVSTLMIAALFNPLRARIQTAVDRRFYRRKYDAAQVLASFSASVRDEVDLNRLTDNLISVVDEAMQPAHVSLWLRKIPQPGRAAHESGSLKSEAVGIPMSFDKGGL